jgi:hypothetical protein
VCCGERARKAICDRLRRADRVRRIRDRKQRTDIRKYCFVCRTVKNWNQLPAEEFGTFHCEPKMFRKGVRKVIIDGVK